MATSLASLKQEEEAFNAVRAALRDAHHVFTKGTPAMTAGGVANNTPLAPEQCVQLLDVFLQLILDTSDDASAYVLSRTFQTEFFDLLCRYVFQPLIFSPSAASGYATQQSFLDLRAAAGKTLNHILLRSTALGAEGVAVSCFRSVVDCDALPQLLATFGNAAIPEVIRCSTAEAVFIFILRFGAEGQSLFLQHQGLNAVTNALVVDSSTVVRNYSASILRELAEGFSSQISTPPSTLSVCLRVMAVDPSPDVRILAVETLTLCIRNCTETRYVLMRPHEILQAIDETLFTKPAEGDDRSPVRSLSASPRRGGTAPANRDADLAVRDATCRLLQTCCLVASAASIEDFFDVATQMRLAQKCALHSTGALQPHTATGAKVLKQKASLATCLRFLIQYTPHRFQVGETIVHDFPSLSSLLKALIDAGKFLGQDSSSLSSTPTTGLQETFDAYCVELAVSAALITAQSPQYRHHLQKELLSVPMWATTLKASIVGCLNKASLEFFGTVDVLDATGVYLNTLDGVEWSEANKPRRNSIVSIFEKQEVRVSNGGVAVQRSPLPLPEAKSDEEFQRRSRLTFILLNFAVHLALSLPEPTVPPQTQLGGGSTPQPQTPRGGGDAMRRVSPSPVSRADPYATPATPRGGAGATGRGASASRASVFNGPHFPNVASQTPNIQSDRSALTPKEREALAVAFDKFNSSFQLVLQLAECYGKKKRDESLYVTTNDGFVVRAQKLKNPWGPVVQKPSLRSWNVKDVEDGDLFYFAIPFDDLNDRSIGIVMERAKRHLIFIKKAIVTVPQSAKGRRWFLYDSLNFALPRTLNILNELRQLCNDHGEANLRFPVFLFREKEMHLGERCLHPGNLIEVVDQVKFYFSQRPTDLVGVREPSLAELKKKIDMLQSKKFQGNEELSPPPSDDDDDDDDDGFRGHGAVSSESEGES